MVKLIWVFLSMVIILLIASSAGAEEVNESMNGTENVSLSSVANAENQTNETNPALTVVNPVGGDTPREAPVPPDFRAPGKDVGEASNLPVLLIITPAEFVDELMPLKEWKDRTGIKTEIISLEEIYAYAPYNGYDSAEEVRHCIWSYETYYDTHYFMLVGDCDKFPVRYTLYNRADVPSVNFCYMKTDLYYSDLYRAGSYYDWDDNNDNYYGQLNGETITGTVNIDNINMQYPDVAVGRVPASTGAEVTTYVNKVISYEGNSYKSTWFKNALFITEEATGAIPDNWCSIYNNAQTVNLAGFGIKKLYYAGNPCGETTDAVTAANINTAINAGKGFVCYFDHGDPNGWTSYSISDIAGLTNEAKLPVIIAAACGTSLFANEPPYHPYTDMSGTYHVGTNNGEVFISIAPRPNNIQITENPESFGEYITVKTPDGAVAYIGCGTGGQAWAGYLAEGFFEGYDTSFGTPTLGNVWNYAIWHYYQDHPAPATINPVNWYTLAGVHQPWKHFLFGDPSLRIGGVSAFQKPDFAGTYQMNHDGWKGTLVLEAEDEDWIESIPPITGTYTGSDGKAHAVRGAIRTWQYPLDPSWGVDWQINFTIDFADTPGTFSDDQIFQGYLFTHGKNIIAGKTWWNNVPFGFYAVKTGTLSSIPVEESITAEDQAFIESILAQMDDTGKSEPGYPVNDEQDFVGNYAMNHDGWRGELRLREPTSGTLPNLVGTYANDQQVYNARAYVRSSTNPIPAAWGPDHQIELYIDFAKTPTTTDDQAFQGYLFTGPEDAMGGVTWWNTAPFGYFATKKAPNRGIFRPSSWNNWILDKSTDGIIDVRDHFGSSTDKPLVGDFNNDGTTDRAVFRNGDWITDYNCDGSTNTRPHYGQAGDIPLVGDMNAGTVADRAVFRAGEWIFDYSMDGTTNARNHYGQAGDIPLIGDFDNNGTPDRAVFRAGEWIIDYSMDGTTNARNHYGQAGDIPLIGDFNKDGATDRALFRAGEWIIDYNMDGTTNSRPRYGQAGDIPLAWYT